jgi:23S rRNA (cytidine1920-2'-O)/16S rRNA (cytidine1409-2'-O)-methyltransferase
VSFVAKAARPARKRLEEVLVDRGLSADLEAARRAIWSGEVIVDGELVDQAARPVPVTAEVRFRRRRRYATRGGEKLAEALAAFGIAVAGRCALDIGAAGGGFTDCLLACGASRVYAVDVARGQLAQRLRADPRVMDLGGRDVMALQPDELVPAPSLATVDVTFRSLSTVLPKAWSLLAQEREACALVKPLHEAKLAGLAGAELLQESVFAWLLPRLRESGIPVRDVIPCRASGRGGAREFFLHARPPAREETDLRPVVEAAVARGIAMEITGSRPKRSGRKRRATWRQIG